MSKTRRIAKACPYRYSGRDGRHERKIVRQFEQIGNRQGKSNIAIKRDVLLATMPGMLLRSSSVDILTGYCRSGLSAKQIAFAKPSPCQAAPL